MREPTQNKRGKQSDNLLLETVIMYPELSQYEIAKQLKWQNGKVDGAIRRLVNQKLIVIKSLERNGRTVNLIYPRDTTPSDVIDVPVKLLQFENGEWLNRAFIYALDSTTIGIAGCEIPEWKEFAPFKAEIPTRQKEKIILKIPEKFSRFYGIGRKHATTSIRGNSILITISGNIVKEKKYPS